MKATRFIHLFQMIYQLKCPNHSILFSTQLYFIIYQSNRFTALIQQIVQQFKSFFHWQYQLFIVSVATRQKPYLIDKLYVQEFVYYGEVTFMRWIKGAAIKSHIYNIFHQNNNLQHILMREAKFKDFRIFLSFPFIELQNIKLIINSMGCDFSIEQTKNKSHHLRHFRKFKNYNDRVSATTQVFEKVSKVTNYSITESDENLLNNTLSKHYLLFRLPTTQRYKLITSFNLYKCGKGSEVFSKGSPATLFFIIRSGKVSISLQKQKNSSVLEKGSYFGDLALLYSAPRSASVFAETDCEFLCIEHQTFRQVIQEIVKKNFNIAKSFIDKVPVFRFLSKKQKNALAYNTHCIRFEKDHTIFKEGDDANAFYIVTLGKVLLEIPGKPKFQMKPGESFGENCFDPNQQRSGKCVTQEKTSLLSISRETLKQCLGNQLQQISFYNIMKWGLNRDKLFTTISQIQREKIMIASELKVYKNDQVICEQSSKAKFIIICLEGKVNQKQPGTVFNSEYLTAENENQMKMTKKIVKKEEGYVAQISFEAIFAILGRNIFIYRSIVDKKEFNQITLQNTAYLFALTLSDFQIKRKLGEGHFGKVYLVEDKYERLYAIKCIKKQRIEESQTQENLNLQKQILSSVSNPFIVKMYRTFQDKYNLYFLLKYIDGADFFDILRQIGLCDRKKGQFYSACIILALENLHAKNIVYRDLKPENAVIDQKGFLHLIDMGSAKVLNEQNGFRTFTVIGTPHYMAPQVVEVSGYSFASDLWSLGIVLYEMMCGALPFGNEISDPYEIFQEVDVKQVNFPKFYTDATGKELILGLLSRNPSERFSEDITKIKNMVFYNDFDWDALSKKTISVPFRIKSKIEYQKINANLVEYIESEQQNKEIDLKWYNNF